MKNLQQLKARIFGKKLIEADIHKNTVNITVVYYFDKCYYLWKVKRIQISSNLKIGYI